MGRKLPQFIAATCVCIGALGTGTVLGWTSNITDDLKEECPLAPFASGSTVQRIPFVILPLKGQIIHPSREISFTGLRMPLCAITGAKYMTENGWAELRNPLDDDVPFRLYRDDARTFLQWYGNSDLRTKLFGRLVLVQLMCREVPTATGKQQNEKQIISSPCIAFRIDGSPYKHIISNVSEVIFVPDVAYASTDTSAGSASQLTATEYVAIGICSVLLGLVYVASVFLYLHLRRKNKPAGKLVAADGVSVSGGDLRASEEGVGVGVGVIKNNPLLAVPSLYMHNNGGGGGGIDPIYSDTNSSDDTEAPPDIIRHHGDHKKHQTTSAMVHYQLKMQQQEQQQQQNIGCSSFGMHRLHFSMIQAAAGHDSTTEKLPEENVSIVETMETREERPENIRALTATTRRKLYFNPAYFEPQLLLTPPPAAVDFLYKIREVISIAKEKMALKRFSPSLMNIPEEEANDDDADDGVTEARLIKVRWPSRPAGRSARRTNVNLKRENSRRRRTCGGCPGCEPMQMAARGRTSQQTHHANGKLPEFSALPACQNCQILPSDNKQTIIRKWLEDIPVVRNGERISSVPGNSSSSTLVGSPRRLRSPTRSLPPNQGRSASSSLLTSPSDSHDFRASCGGGGSPRPASERQHRSKNASTSPKPKRKTRKSHHPPPPPTQHPDPHGQPQSIAVPVPIPDFKKQPHNQTNKIMNLPPPDMIQEAMEVDRTEKRVALTKKQQEEIIKGLTFHQNLILRDTERQPPMKSKLANPVDYETDSLERIARKGEFSSPVEYVGREEGTVASPSPSPYPSPSLSLGGAALPDQEEMTMRNAIFNTRTGHMTISKISVDTSSSPISKQHNHQDDYQLIVTRRGGGVHDHDGDDDEIGSTSNGPLQVRKDGEYSLVSEVYVNNGYNYGSAPSSPGSSSSSTMERRRALKVKYDENDNKPGKLLIEVEDCADHYIPVCESDGFEPDTLDRKPQSSTTTTTTMATATEKQISLSESWSPVAVGQSSNDAKLEFVDSLERPSQILLRTTGSFRSDAIRASTENLHSGKLTRVFGSLRDIYEAKIKCGAAGTQQQQQTTLKQSGLLYSFIDGDGAGQAVDADDAAVADEKGRILTLEERHSKRQRAKNAFIQPDLIPPPPTAASVAAPAPSFPPPHDSFLLYESRSPQNGGTQGAEVALRSLQKNGNCRSAISSSSSNSGHRQRPPVGGGTPAVSTPARAPLADFELCLLQRRPAHKVAPRTTTTTTNANARLVNAADVILTKQMDDRYVLHLCQVSMALSKKRNANRNGVAAEAVGSSPGMAVKEDSGYLSSGDSCEDSKKGKTSLSRSPSPSISEESEESLEEGRSESGAESVETHSVFFDRIEPVDTDSSEPVSYATVVPVRVQPQLTTTIRTSRVLE